MTRQAPAWSRLALIAMWTLALLPPLAVALYAFSTRWDRSLLPEGASLRWLVETLRSVRVRDAVAETAMLSLASALLTLVVGGSADRKSVV